MANNLTPGSVSGDWGLDKEAMRAATPGQMFGRAFSFMAPGTGYKREAFKNAFGLLSKQQKAQTGFGGVFARAQNAFIGYDIAKSAVNGDFDDIPVQAGVYFGGAVGFRVGQSTAIGFSKLNPQLNVRGIGYRTGALKAGNLKGFLKGPARNILGGSRVAGFIGGGLGAIAGAAVIGGLAYVATSSIRSNNLVNQVAYNMTKQEMNQRVFQSQGSMTHRQRGLEKISRSALNNRGILLGNEASVLAFGY